MFCQDFSHNLDLIISKTAVRGDWTLYFTNLTKNGDQSQDILRFAHSDRLGLTELDSCDCVDGKQRQ